ncbi:MAG: TRAP transporter substrate-binding protein DctP, partial [Pseudomonadota bacterium]
MSAWPKTTFMVQNFTRFMDRTNEKAAKMYPGELEIKYKGGPEVISFKEQVEAARTGLIDMVFTATSYYTSIIPVGDGFSASALKPWEERDKGVFEFMQKIHAEKANVFFLSRMGSGIPFQIHTNQPVKSVADLKGMKLRCSPTLIPFLKKIGVNPVMMKPGDIYTALERGVVQGYVWPAAQMRERGWEKVTKYVIEPPTPYQAIDVVLVNLDVPGKNCPNTFRTSSLNPQKRMNSVPSSGPWSTIPHAAGALQREPLPAVLQERSGISFQERGNDVYSSQQAAMNQDFYLCRLHSWHTPFGSPSVGELRSPYGL